jgi:hypothetical protein
MDLTAIYNFRELGDYRSGLEACETYLESHPDDADGWNIKGVLLEALGDDEAAEAAYEQAIGLDPEHQEAQGNLTALRQAAEIEDSHDQTSPEGIIWRSALYFGLLFALIHGVTGYLQYRWESLTLVLVFNWLLFTLAGAVLAAGVGRLVGTRRLSSEMFLAGGFGFGSGYLLNFLLLTWFVGNQDTPYVNFIAALQAALPLMLGGWAIGRMLATRAGRYMLVVWGLVGGLFEWWASSGLFNLFVAGFIEDLQNSGQSFTLGDLQLPSLLHGLSLGLLVGLLYGAGLAWIIKGNLEKPAKSAENSI